MKWLLFAAAFCLGSALQDNGHCTRVPSNPSPCNSTTMVNVTISETSLKGCNQTVIRWKSPCGTLNATFIPDQQPTSICLYASKLYPGIMEIYVLEPGGDRVPLPMPREGDPSCAGHPDALSVTIFFVASSVQVRSSVVEYRF